MMDAFQGVLAASSEREFLALILGSIIGGTFTFALAWKILGTSRDIQIRQIDSIDKTVARIGDDPTGA